MKHKREDQADWWRLNPSRGSTYTIEFTFDTIMISGVELKGAVRAKLDSLSTWQYRYCEEARYALQWGEIIIRNQRKRRQA